MSTTANTQPDLTFEDLAELWDHTHGPGMFIHNPNVRRQIQSMFKDCSRKEIRRSLRTKQIREKILRLLFAWAPEDGVFKSNKHLQLREYECLIKAIGNFLREGTFMTSQLTLRPPGSRRRNPANPPIKGMPRTSYGVFSHPA